MEKDIENDAESVVIQGGEMEAVKTMSPFGVRYPRFPDLYWGPSNGP